LKFISKPYCLKAEGEAPSTSFLAGRIKTSSCALPLNLLYRKSCLPTIVCMRLLGILASLLALAFYLTKVIRFLSRNKRKSRGSETDSVDSRLKRAKQANVIEVKTVASEKTDGNH